MVQTPNALVPAVRLRGWGRKEWPGRRLPRKTRKSAKKRERKQQKRRGEERVKETAANYRSSASSAAGQARKRQASSWVLRQRPHEKTLWRKQELLREKISPKSVSGLEESGNTYIRIAGLLGTEGCKKKRSEGEMGGCPLAPGAAEAEEGIGRNAREGRGASLILKRATLRRKLGEGERKVVERGFRKKS